MKSYPLHSTPEETGLIEQAKIAMDENVSSEPLAALGDLDTLKLDEIMLSKVEDAARLVEEGAAHHLLDGGKAIPTGGAMVTGADGKGYVNLPADFMRLVSFKLAGWKTAVTEAITEEHPAYLMQGSRWAGIHGNSERPVVAIVHRDGGYRLEFWSADGIAVIERALYIPLPVITDGRIALCPRLRSAVVYRIASMSAAILGMSDQAAMLLGTSNELAGITGS